MSTKPPGIFYEVYTDLCTLPQRETSKLKSKKPLILFIDFQKRILAFYEVPKSTQQMSLDQHTFYITFDGIIRATPSSGVSNTIDLQFRGEGQHIATTFKIQIVFVGSDTSQSDERILLMGLLNVIRLKKLHILKFYLEQYYCYPERAVIHSSDVHIGKVSKIPVSGVFSHSSILIFSKGGQVPSAVLPLSITQWQIKENRVELMQPGSKSNPTHFKQWSNKDRKMTLVFQSPQEWSKWEKSLAYEKTYNKTPPDTPELVEQQYEKHVKRPSASSSTSFSSPSYDLSSPGSAAMDDMPITRGRSVAFNSSPLTPISPSQVNVASIDEEHEETDLPPPPPDDDDDSFPPPPPPMDDPIPPAPPEGVDIRHSQLPHAVSGSVDVDDRELPTAPRVDFTTPLVPAVLGEECVGPPNTLARSRDGSLQAPASSSQPAHHRKSGFRPPRASIAPKSPGAPDDHNKMAPPPPQYEDEPPLPSSPKLSQTFDPQQRVIIETEVPPPASTTPKKPLPQPPMQEAASPEQVHSTPSAPAHDTSRYPTPPGCYYITELVDGRVKYILTLGGTPLGILDPTFVLPSTASNGDLIYGVLPYVENGLAENAFITTNGLILAVDSELRMDDEVFDIVLTETDLFLDGQHIADRGVTIYFILSGAVPGSERELEHFLPKPESAHPPLPQANNTPQFTFGTDTGVDITIMVEGGDEPLGIVTVPPGTAGTTFTFADLRLLIDDELDDVPDDYVFLFNNIRITKKQESKRNVTSLPEPHVTIRNQTKQAEAPPIVAPQKPAPVPPGRAPPRPTAPARRSPASDSVPESPIPQNRPTFPSADELLLARQLQQSAPKVSKTAQKPSFLDEISKFKTGTNQLKKVDQSELAKQRQLRMTRSSVVGGMFVSLRGAMDHIRGVVEESDEDESDDDDMWD